ncbi:MAG: outer membrane beta-barrel protein [Verrucomicrobia bacterium]|nr:outer membrane beta-barrel protein [Verrucomicrobiota bacterium]
MKRFATSAGLVALGALGVAPAHAEDTGKPWNVSASLRGFYDDNWNTAPSHSATPRASSYGIELSPSLGYKETFGPTQLTLGYIYGLKYYENRPGNDADHSHQADLKVHHDFPERYKLDLTDSFAVSQEPGVLDPASITTPFRSNGNNIRNTVGLTFGAELTPLFSLEVGYSNSFYDYEETGTDSRSALLDRIEHLGHADLRWQARADTIGILGYQFGYTDQTSKDIITTIIGPQPASVRDARSHYGYVGVDENFTPELLGSLRVGYQYTEYPKAPAGLPQSSSSPYVDASGTWKYSPDGTVQLGVKHTRNATDVLTAMDAESTTVYGQLTHNIASVFKTSLIAQFQNSEFKGGLNNGLQERIFLGGVNVAYDIIKERLTAETGYNYDRVDSEIVGRSLYRHRVYIGLKASY